MKTPLFTLRLVKFQFLTLQGHNMKTKEETYIGKTAFNHLGSFKLGKKKKMAQRKIKLT